MKATQSIKGRIRSSAANSQKPGIVTELDGRRYAIELLQALEHQIEKDNKAGLSGYSAQAEDEPAGQPPQISIYRTGKQSRTLARAFSRLYGGQASEAALGGFWVVWTDWIGSVIGGSVPSADDYLIEEMNGRLPAWGSVTYSNPAAARAAIELGEMVYRQ